MGVGEGARTIKGLRLDVEAAQKGKTWLLLPDKFRSQESGRTYPLPSSGRAIQQIAGIYLPPGKADGGCEYIRRAIKAHKKRQNRKQSAAIDAERQLHDLTKVKEKYERQLTKMQKEAAAAVAEVKERASEAVASLHELFDLGRQGMQGQMKAHLDNKQWKGEKIPAAAFRQCFRLISQAVKGLGLPSDQQKKARDAILQEVASSIDSTQEALAMAPGPDDENPEKAN
jgi:hypothetical protein